MSFYMAIKEVWRNKGRFFLFSLVIALITMLVLFIAGLAEGLATANREYLAKMDAELLVFQADAKLSTLTSRLGKDTLAQVRRVPGVLEVGAVGLSNGSLVFRNGLEDLDVSLIGVEPGKPGGAPALKGRNLRSTRAYEAVIDGRIARKSSLQVGDRITIKTVQGTEEKYFDLNVVGITDGRQYFFQPSVFVPIQVWDRIRPQPVAPGVDGEIAYNILAVRLRNPAEQALMAARLQSQVDEIEVVDLVTAYEASPGYSAQQGTLNTQRGFTLLIGILVIGGFFQIQTLQKVPNIGMLKAIGASNLTVGFAVVLQIIAVTFFGVLLGTLGTVLLSLALPADIPIQFTQTTLLAAMASLMLIGPLGGLVSVRLALKVEPLVALGLSS